MEDLSIFLAQLFAIYFVVAGISLFAKQDAVRKLISHLEEYPFMLYFSGFLTLIIGSMLVLSHNVWDGSWRVVITMIS